MANRLTGLLNIKFPLVQAGMVWCSGWKLASAVSNAGGLGTLGSGSMYPEVLRGHIQKMRQHTDKPFAVNIPLLYKHSEANIQVVLEEGVKIVITSAGNPAKYTAVLKEKGITVLHVVANAKFALKAQESGVDAVIFEGFEAGGHNGREETTTMVLLETLRPVIHLPLIAAGGIGSGKTMLALMCMGADGVQIGSRFVATPEASAHQAFKDKVIEIFEGDTRLLLKKVSPTRMITNNFAKRVMEFEDRGATNLELTELLGTGRSRKGMFEGDMEQGELEIGQIASTISALTPAGDLVTDIMAQYQEALNDIKNNDAYDI